MARKKIAVLGSNAFSGQDFIDLCLDNADYDVMAISRSPEKSPIFLKYRSHHRAEDVRFFQMDFNQDMTALLALLDAERPQWIVNFAAQSEVGPSWEHPEHWFQTNTVALSLLVNHLRRQTYLERYLHVSSPEAYGSCEGIVKEDAPLNPSTPYAASKAAADMLLSTYHQAFDFPLLTVRATNVYGARQQLFKIIVRSMLYIKSGKTIQVHGGGKAVKSYIHIRDVSRGELSILEAGTPGQCYHLSPASGISIRDVIEKICMRMGVAYDAVTETVAERVGQDKAYIIDSTLARQRLGWTDEIGMDAGLDEVADWIETHEAALREHDLAYQHRP